MLTIFFLSLFLVVDLPGPCTRDNLYHYACFLFFQHIFIHLPWDNFHHGEKYKILGFGVEMQNFEGHPKYLKKKKYSVKHCSIGSKC
jgi:hypothetical protein